MRAQLELDNAVAAELAGSNDAVLRALEAHLDCDLYLRGNIVTLDGGEEAVEAAKAVVGELSDLAQDLARRLRDEGETWVNTARRYGIGRT